MTLARLDKSIAANPALLHLPEKAIQFGTGAFLRGFIEYFIDEANRQGHFNGRIVAVGSTGSGRDKILGKQDGLYTLAIRGIENGEARSEYLQISSLSRALAASTEWHQVLECAKNPELQFIFSNTTETGIRYDETDSPGPAAPRSFPGKLTSLLHARARHFNYAPDAGVIVLPCELIENNGATLKAIVLQLAVLWKLEPEFTRWLEEAVPFCNTLVDRIVPGEPDGPSLEEAWNDLGYSDELLTVCEVYRLFAIEATADVAKRITFAAADPNVIVADDIRPYRQRKLRLLNGTHTISVPAALLSDCVLVSEAVNDEHVGPFMQRVLFGELVPSTDVVAAEDFARQVLDRFSNPYIKHALIDITLQQTLKMRVRVVPAILDYAKRTGHAPAALALGFAAYLIYVRDAEALRADDEAGKVRALVAGLDLEQGVARACAARQLWGADLSAVPGFVERVTECAQGIAANGMRATLEQQLAAMRG